MDFSQNDDELAMIMAHEMAHAILEHSAESMSRDQLLGMISISVIFLVWMIFPTDLFAFSIQNLADELMKYALELPYSRSLESEAVNKNQTSLVFAF